MTISIRLIRLSLLVLLCAASFPSFAQPAALAEARGHAAAGRPAEAKTVLDRALATDSLQPALLTERGLAHAALKDDQAAFADYTRALAVDSLYAPALEYRGALLATYQRYPDALTDYERLLRKPSPRAPLHLRRGQYRYENRLLPGARQDLDRALSLDPKLAEAHLTRGYLNLVENKAEAAEKDFLESLRLDTTLADAHLQLGLLYTTTDPAKARQAMDRAVAISRSPAAYYARGSLRQDLTDHAGAVADCDSAIKRSPFFVVSDCDIVLKLAPTPLAFTNRANARYNQRKYMEALPDLYSAIKLDANFAPALLLRGLTRYQLELKATACVDLAKAEALGNAQAASFRKKICGTSPAAPGQTPPPGATPAPAKP
jgi:tetratricopeptide (TPR) repeat protein